MDKKTRTTWLVTSAVMLAAGTWTSIRYVTAGEEDSPIVGFIFGAFVFAPAGYLLSLKFTRPRRKLGPNDIERNWWARARAQAFLDMTVVTSAALMALSWIPSIRDANAGGVLILLMLVGVLDLVFHYWRIRTREQ